eukprot:GFUD01081477.1.p1 GENE.GFUD01081477.1~~GFUD01081477.1.p1  ORF type:complete len:628 (-),score=97.71 GFUD01081477.1:131-1951(-)
MLVKTEWVKLVLCSLLYILLLPVRLTHARRMEEDLIVNTMNGKVEGFKSMAANRRRVSAWYGIPYAQPPVGNLRFRHPLPADSWEGVKQTSELPNSCVQIRDSMWPGFEGSEAWNTNTPQGEDCLYLNVVVPNPHPKNTAVLLWIYGEGFWGGTTTLDMYDLRTIVSEENIIAVGIQYRVASLGFLSLNTAEAPGNAGLFDQLMAMQWVKDNIHEFGGNPNNITIMGQGAGAVSVGLHLLSPLSRNLFSQAIMQSASPTVPWGVITEEESLLRGLRLAELIGCPHDKNNTINTIECLRKANATSMVVAEWNGVADGLTVSIFTPIVDGSFLDVHPSVSLENKEFKKTNIIMGTNKDEGFRQIFYYMTDMFPKEEQVLINRDDFKRSIDETNFNTNLLQRKAIEYEYTNWMNPEDPISNRQQVDRFTGDPLFTCPVVEFAHQYAENGNNVYMYHFSHHATVSPWPSWSGALHGDEVAFVFGVPFNESRGYNKREIQLSKDMMTYWANFAKTGNPSLAADRTWTDTYWPLHTPDKRETLHLYIKYSIRYSTGLLEETPTPPEANIEKTDPCPSEESTVSEEFEESTVSEESEESTASEESEANTVSEE